MREVSPPKELFDRIVANFTEIHSLPICDAAANAELDFRTYQVRKAVRTTLQSMIEKPSTLSADRKEIKRQLHSFGDSGQFALDLSAHYLAEREQPLERGFREAQRILRDGYCESQGAGGWKRSRAENRTVQPADPNWFVPLSFTDSKGKYRHLIVYAARVGLVKKEMYFGDLDDDLRIDNWPTPHQPTPINIVNINNESDFVDAAPDSDKSFDTRPGMTREVYRAMVEQSARNKWPLPDVIARGDQKTYTFLTGDPLVWYDIAYAGMVSNGVAEIGSFGSYGPEVNQLDMYYDFTNGKPDAELFTFRPCLEVDPVTGDIIDVRMPKRFVDY